MQIFKKIIYLILISILITSCNFLTEKTDKINNTNSWVIIESEKLKTEINKEVNIEINDSDIELKSWANVNTNNKNNIWQTNNSNVTKPKELENNKNSDDVIIDETIKEIDDFFKVLETENGL